MKKLLLFTLLVCCLPLACSSIRESSRLESFGKVTKDFEHALRMADYNKAAGFLDPKGPAPKSDVKKIKNYKIVDVKITHVDVSDDKLEITQDVEIQYFRLNGNILHTAHQSQTWRYQPDSEVWLLQSGLPELGPEQK